MISRANKKIGDFPQNNYFLIVKKGQNFLKKLVKNMPFGGG